MRELIERLEKAAGPDRELDAEIAAHLQIVPEFDRSIIRQDVTLRFVPNDGGIGRVRVYCSASPLPLHGRAVPSYTSSLDSALSLVPEGCFWSCGGPDNTLITRPKPWAEIWQGKASEWKGEGATPAIALVIAALKARLQMSPEVKAGVGGQ